MSTAGITEPTGEVVIALKFTAGLMVESPWTQNCAVFATLLPYK
jgi:hypothetical protein